ncbi:hypothetical protein [Reyranella sp.]|uniref:hypothetical protein n=1 Tax=Reyranella sp. TaxID=1929291 RepID=UPI004035C8A2
MAQRLGSSLENAIVIVAKDSAQGVAIQEMFLGQIFGGKPQFVRQALVAHGDRTYDCITLLVEGQRELVYFDISSFLSAKMHSVAPSPAGPTDV